MTIKELLQTIFIFCLFMFFGWGIIKIGNAMNKEEVISNSYRDKAKKECAEKGFQPELTITQVTGRAAYETITDADANNLIVTCQEVVRQQIKP